MSEPLLQSILKSFRSYQAEEGKYGIHYFDKPIDPGKPLGDDEFERDEEDDLDACAINCCDEDCECDDCLRCANSNLHTYEDDDARSNVSAAAA